MLNGFDERLNRCLEALSSGERTLDECLAMYPKDAARLEPLLRAAMRLGEALTVEPRPEFQAARQRFVAAAGQSLAEAVDAGPRPSFVAAARRRFLAAAQAMLGTGQPRGWRPVPVGWGYASYLRPVAVSLTACVLAFIGFGVFAVSTSGDALPGDWRYPVKRATEDIRLAFAFDDDARRGVKIDLANERLSEIERLAEKGRSIGGDLLGDLQGETSSVVGDLSSPGAEAGTAREIATLARKQQEVLAKVEPLVAPDAEDEFRAAQETSAEAYVRAAQAFAIALLAERGTTGPETSLAAPGETPEVGELVTPEPPSTPSEETPGPDETPEATTPMPSAPPAVLIEREPAAGGETIAGVVWDRVVIGRFSVEIPSELSGWRVVGVAFAEEAVAPAPNLLRVMNADGTAIVVINPRNGDVFWYEYRNGLFEELIVRLAVGDEVWQADPIAIEGFGAANAGIVLRILETIYIEPEPTPTPEPSATPTPEATLTPEGGEIEPQAVTPTPAS